MDFHRNHYILINQRLETEYSAFKQQFQDLQNKLLEKRSSSTDPKINPRSYLQLLKKRLEIHKKDHSSLRNLVNTYKDVNLELQLEQQIKSLQEQLNFSKKENERLNRMKFISNNSFSSNNDFFAAEEEIFKLKSQIQVLTEKNRQTNDLIEKFEDKIMNLRPLYEELTQKIEPDKFIETEKEEKFKLLDCKLKVLQASFNSKKKRLLMRVNDLEKTLKALNYQIVSSNTKLFKRSQQKRLIEISKSEAMLNRSKTKSPAKDHLVHPDVSFFYKPSVSRLYI